MKKLALNSKKVLFTVSNLEKKHKIITYVSLVFLTVSTYFLRTENHKVKTEFKTLKEKSNSLKQNMVLFNRNYEGFPLPVWQKIKKEDQFIIQYINPEYVVKFGHIFNNDKYQLLGKNNFELFPEDIAKLYFKHDLEVAKTGKKIESLEEVYDKTGHKLTLKVIKWRKIKNNRDTLIYGMVKEILPYENLSIKNKSKSP